MKSQRESCKPPSMSDFTNSISWSKKISPPCFAWHEWSDLWKLEGNILYNSRWHARGDGDKIKFYKAKSLVVLIWWNKAPMFRLMSCFGTLGVINPLQRVLVGEKGNWKLCWKAIRWDWELPDLFSLLKGQPVNQAVWRSSEMWKLDSHPYRKSWIASELPGKWRSAVIVVFTWWWPRSSYWSALKMCSLPAPQSWAQFGLLEMLGSITWQWWITEHRERSLGCFLYHGGKGLLCAVNVFIHSWQRLTNFKLF